MLLANVESFLEVARQGNMRRAAETLYVSQPTLTARIQALEAELEATLFRRSRSGMTLTAAGRAFMPYAERALESLRGGTALVRDVERGVAGELAIGAAAAVSAYVLPELLARFTAEHPDVRLLVRTGHSEELVDAVVRGEVALGLVGAPRRAGRAGRSRGRARPRRGRPSVRRNGRSTSGGWARRSSSRRPPRTTA